ncbi:MAG TPA: M23 family metallopeptidase [Thermomicrobiales bacterium]|nr:M23 family metallopeptidase [Thermomicrobiales bacterium]
MPGDRIDDVVLYPVFNRRFVVSEHPEGELPYLGDALGCDCMVVRFQDGRISLHDGDGSRNEHWHGWGAAVLAPFDGVVESVHTCPFTIDPGHPSSEQPGSIVFRRDDGVGVLYGHVDGLEVEAGDAVTSGQRVARVGNNGFSWYPHVHVGAWLKESPLQIRFDLGARGRLLAEDPERYEGKPGTT